MIKNIIKHVIIILLVILILFPMFWIVTTSIRRDNAAFSTELISNRLTLQNYKDLIFKTPNVPQRISEMKKIITISDEYSDLSREELLNRLNREEVALRNQLQQSVTLIKKSDASVKRVVAFASEKTGTVEGAFAGLKSEEITYLNRLFDEKLSVSDAMKTALSYELIQDLNKVSGSEKEAYLSLIGDTMPDFTVAYNQYDDRLASARGEIGTEYTDWMTRVAAQLDDETKATLNEIQANFITLLTPGEFSYSKWNREISLKGYKKMASSVDEQVSEAEAIEWTAITDTFKTLAQDLDVDRKAYEQAYSESVAVFEKQMATDEAVMKAYESLEADRKQNFNTTTSLQSEVESLEQEKMDLENRLSMLEDKMASTVFELQQLKVLFTTELQNPEKILDDKLSVDKFNGYLSEAAILHTELQEAEQVEQNQTLSELLLLFDWFVQNTERIRGRYAYPSVQDGFKVFGNLISPTRLNRNDYIVLAQARQENKAAIAEKNTELDDLRATLNTINDKIEQAKVSYDEINGKSVQIAELKMLLNLKLSVSTVAGYDSISAYNAEVETYVSEFGGLENPEKEILSEISRMDKLVFLDRNYETEATALFETVREMEKLLDQFDERKETYLNLTFADVPIQINELTQLDQLQKTEYKKFSAELNRLGRVAVDLSELEEYTSIRKDLTTIDKNIYETMQLWIKKPEQQFMLWLINTVILAVVTAGLTVLICAVGAYPFSRLRFQGRKYGLLFLLLVQMFPTIMGMVALYLLLRFIGQFMPGFGLDSLGGLGLIYLGNIAFNMWLLKGYFDTIPNSLEEAAMIDGSTRFQTFWKIILPLAAPMLSVVFLIVFMANFNEYLLASVVLQSPEKYTFAVGLRSFAYSSEYQMEWGLFTAASLLGAIPMVILSLSLQKYLVSGLTSGAVKG
ncbi:MAG TPA: ABC transporter permease subunit [Thermotogota bacterium]|nr:ABC transporter permease subunit [Thermotogota bacterium]HPJ88273.1 ABC transporter permease subunit [Thermotogota bacterium]HPR96749.1 ABC transporter permease subunit [Thermotogota bacterium]